MPSVLAYPVVTVITIIEAEQRGREQGVPASVPEEGSGLLVARRDLAFVLVVCQVPHTGWLKLQQFISSQFWRLEVGNRGVSRGCSF